MNSFYFILLNTKKKHAALHHMQWMEELPEYI
jgi:hypothetical protein